jgi:hypothetical protein
MSASTNRARAASVVGGALLGVALLAGCDTVAGTESPRIDDIAQDVGCVDPTLVDTPDPSVQQAYACQGGGVLLIFDNPTSREDYLQVAADDPSNYVAGDYWAYLPPAG